MSAKIWKGTSIKPYTTYHIGGRARLLTVVYDSTTLAEAVGLCEPYCILGKGSNVLVSDDGFDGLVIVNAGDFLVREDDAVVCDSGLSLSRLSRYYAEQGLAGLAWACGIPASVGGAVIMNAGAFGGCMADVTLWADILRGGKEMRLTAEQLQFGYRTSSLGGKDVVLRIGLRAAVGDREQIAAQMAENLRVRRQKQPPGFSAGSVFRAAEGGLPAGKLIDEAGLKGLTAGGAKISEKHANFIVNNGYATAKDVRQLIDTAKAVVFANTGIRLHEEIRYIGDFY